MPSNEPIIRVDGVWKRYGIGPALRERFDTLIGRPPTDAGLWALQNISFDVRPGEVLAIVGRNGAGKSTLLKTLAGVVRPTRGSVHVSGRIFPMIELNAGMHLDLTGRENARLLAAVMGVRRSEIELRIPEIHEFSELGGWFDRPVRKYSSGMLSRLGFAVAFNIESDVMLVDEVMAVGDLGFQRKCLGFLEDRRRRGCAILLVSHSLRHVLRLADRAIMLEQGKLVASGTPEQVVKLYETQTVSREMERHRNRASEVVCDETLIRNPRLEIVGTHPDGAIDTHDPLTVRLHFDAIAPVKRPNFGVAVASTEGLGLLGITSDDLEISELPAGPNQISCTFRSLPLIPGVYGIVAKMMVARGAGVVYKTIVPSPFKVLPGRCSLAEGGAGFFAVTGDWDFDTKDYKSDESEKHDSVFQTSPAGGPRTQTRQSVGPADRLRQPTAADKAS